MTDGVLVIDKPTGMTSHDVVDVVRKRLSTKKVGHAGTLDPDATGLLLVGVGRATRFLSYAQDAPKRYAATAKFGTVTSTQDSSGQVLQTRPCSFTPDDLLRGLEKFTGEIQQVPPMVSAVKVGGERLHAKARRGEEVERAARPVSIFELNLVVQREGDEPEADIDVRCSSGTYVRTLINDIGEVLGCGAHMTALRRTETGGFTLADAKPLDAIGADDLLPLVEIVRVLPRIDLSETDATAVGYGRKLSAEAAPGIKDGQQVGLTVSGSLVAVYRREGDALVADRVVGS